MPPARLEVYATVQPAHRQHWEVERRERRADRQVRISRQELNVALIRRHFSLTLTHSYIKHVRRVIDAARSDKVTSL